MFGWIFSRKIVEEYIKVEFDKIDNFLVVFVIFYCLMFFNFKLIVYFKKNIC